MNQGPFTPEEDAFILQRVKEVKSNGESIKGLWKGLEREMNRTTWAIGYRWTSVLSKQTQQGVENTIEEFSNNSANNGHQHDTDPSGGHQLANYHSQQSASNTQQSSQPPHNKYDTTERTSQQPGKKRRWIDLLSTSDINDTNSNDINISANEAVPLKTGAWSHDEVDTLMEFVAFQNVSYDTSDAANKGRFKINWAVIGENLNRPKDVCYNKHKTVMRTKMTKGEYSEEEEGLIVKRVREWERMCGTPLDVLAQRQSLGLRTNNNIE
eukprot:gene28994-35961_t